MSQNPKEIALIDAALEQLNAENDCEPEERDRMRLVRVHEISEVSHKLKGTFETLACNEMYNRCKTLHLFAKAINAKQKCNAEECEELATLHKSLCESIEVLNEEVPEGFFDA